MCPALMFPEFLHLLNLLQTNLPHRTPMNSYELLHVVVSDGFQTSKQPALQLRRRSTDYDSYVD